MAKALRPPRLTIGFVLMPDFTMLALAGFIDTLRLAADQGDRSRQIDCRWSVMTADGRTVRASNGIAVMPESGLADPARFDYLVVAGGTLHREPELPAELHGYLMRAAALGVPLVGICTGGFVLARAGLMAGRRCCVSWFHHGQLELEFPDLTIVSDQLYVIDRDRITCAGGTSVIHLASHLVEQHVGGGRSAKGLRVMLEERPRPAASPQPLPAAAASAGVTDARVRRAILLMERHLVEPQPIAEIAHAAGTTPRHLGRLFLSTTGTSPARFRERLRLEPARALVTGGDLPLTDIAFRQGFADASHFTRRFVKAFGMTPGAARRAAAGGETAG